MTIMTAYSDETSVTGAVGQLKERLGNTPFSLVLFFASPAYDPRALSRAMKEAFPRASLVGCSTAGELCNDQMLKNSVVAMGLGKEVTGETVIVPVENIRTTDLSEAVSRFESHFKEPFAHMDVSSYVGLILFDGLTRAEERIMDRLGDLTNVIFVGGSAGDDRKFTATHVFADGRVFTDAAVLVLMKPATEFTILKTQSFTCLDKILTVTRADEDDRTVIEFNNKPAVTAYAEAVGCAEDEVENHFMKYPVGLMVDGEPYVRSPLKTDGGRIVFYCQVLEGMDLNLLESDDLVGKTRKDLENIDGISGLINFHCILRTLELEEQSKTREYGDVFTNIPSIGFSTYGEVYLGHLNQTSTMLIFKGGKG